MLTQTHHAGESLILETSDGNITGKRFRLGNIQVEVSIDAPKSVGIYREEVYHDIERRNGLKNKLEGNQQ